VPDLGRVGVIVYPDDAIDALTTWRLSAATHALGITLEQFEIRDLTKLEAVAAAIGRANVEAFSSAMGRLSITPARRSRRW